MSEWQRATLGDLVDIHDRRRIPLSKAERSKRPGPFRYYGAQGVIDHIDDFIFDGKYILVPEDGENLRSRKLPIAYFAEGKFWVNNHAHIISATPGVAVDRFIQSAIEAIDIGAFVTGAAQPKLSQANLKQIELNVPDLETQETIGEILDGFNDLIENNRRRIELLEEMAQAIYREWFVHFRFPGHEGATFVDSPLGPIPEGWEVHPLSNLATVVRGRSYRKYELAEEGGLPFVNLKCMMRGGGFRMDGLKRYTGDYKPQQLVSYGDIVLAVTDLTQGREILAQATLVPRIAEKAGVISLDVARILPTDADDRLPLFFSLRSSDFADRVKEYANGSTVLHLSPKFVEQNELVWPELSLRAAFTEVVEPMVTSLEELRESAERLATMRDLLLPKLVTGEIDVSDLDLDALVRAAS